MSWNASLIDGPIPAFKFLGLDAEGQPTFGAQLPIYNLNVAPSVMSPELEPFVVEPTHPKRVFAGDDPDDRTLTVCLSFASEAEARTYLAAYWTDPDVTV